MAYRAQVEEEGFRRLSADQKRRRRCMDYIE